MKQNYLKSFCARCVTLLVLALLSTNLAWGETATITFANQTSGTSDGSQAYSSSNFVSSGIASSDQAFGTITCSETSNCFSGKIGYGLKAGGSSKAGSFTISFTALSNVTKITLNAASYSASNKSCNITLKTGDTQIGNKYTTSNSSAEFANAEFTPTSTITSLSTLTINTSKYCYIKSITITYSASTPSVEAPKFSVEAGNYPVAQSVELSCATEGASIYYTTNGSEPTAESTPYTSAIAVNKSMTIKAIAIKGDDKSSVATAAYKITTYASLADLVADGDPGSDGYDVTVTLTNEMITGFYTSSSDQQRHGIYLKVDDKDIEVYCQANAVLSEWVVGGKVSGTLSNCMWKDFYGTWELCPSNWSWAEYTAPTTYNITIGEIEHGSVNADMAKAAAGIEVTLTPTPSTGYKFVEWDVYKTDEPSTKVAVTDNKFTMPAYNVTVSATFTAIPSHEAKFFVNGVQSGETQNVYEGDAVVFPANPAAIGTKKFVGWTQSEIETPTDNAPTFVSSATMATENLNFYAVFADATAAQEEWTEITSEPAAGTYAILSDSYFMKAEISSNRFANGSATPQISNGKLTTAPAEDCIWEISKPDTYYRIKNGDKYAGGTETKNQGALLTDASADLAKWTIEYNDDFTIINYGRSQAQSDSNNKYLRNNTTNGWATYASGTGKAPKLFKKSGGTIYTGYCTTVVVKELSSISIKTAPEKIEYYVGDNFDPTGLEITLNYSDESTEDVTYAGNEESFTFNPALDAELKTTDEVVTITYGDKFVDQSITVSVRPIHTVTYYALGTQIGTEQVTEGQTVANAPAATELTGWTFAGWTENESYAMSNTAPEIFDVTTIPITKNIDLYAVYSKTEGEAPVSFSLEVTSGDFTISYNGHYASSAVGSSSTGKISSSTTASDARVYTFTKVSDGVYSIYDKTANKYVSYSSGTNLQELETVYNWTITASTVEDGCWRLTSGTSGRALIYSAGSTNVFGGYATSNVTLGAEYHDVVIKTVSSAKTYYTISNPIVTLTGTPGDVHYATYYGTKSMKVDENTTIATCYVENNTIYVNDLEGNVIPANGAVLLHSTGATITLTETTENANEDDVAFIEDKEFNMLFGYTVDTHVDAATNTYYYALNVSDNKAGFFVPRTTDNTSEPSAANGFTAKAGKAYLKVVSALGAKEGFEFGEPTGIESIQTSVINPQSTIYNLNGVRVNGNYKGIVIVNGKKYINK